MIYQHPLAYLLALEGGALRRAFNGEYRWRGARRPAAKRAAIGGNPGLIVWHFQPG